MGIREMRVRMGDGRVAVPVAMARAWRHQLVMFMFVVRIARAVVMFMLVLK